MHGVVRHHVHGCEELFDFLPAGREQRDQFRPSPAQQRLKIGQTGAFGARLLKRFRQREDLLIQRHGGELVGGEAVAFEGLTRLRVFHVTEIALQLDERIGQTFHGSAREFRRTTHALECFGAFVQAQRGVGEIIEVRHDAFHTGGKRRDAAHGGKTRNLAAEFTEDRTAQAPAFLFGCSLEPAQLRLRLAQRLLELGDFELKLGGDRGHGVSGFEPGAAGGPGQEFG